VSGRQARRADLGLHFLVGGWLASELVEQAGVGAGDLVVEIGAGRRGGAGRPPSPAAAGTRRRPSALHGPGPGRLPASWPVAAAQPGPAAQPRSAARLAGDLGFPLDAGPADLDVMQWAGLQAFLAGTGRSGKGGSEAVG
jgi:hypothetical protein